MARLARIVVPGRAHHVTQRGNRREAIFFDYGDQAIYLDLLAEQTARYEVQVCAGQTCLAFSRTWTNSFRPHPRLPVAGLFGDTQELHKEVEVPAL